MLIRGLRRLPHGRGTLTDILRATKPWLVKLPRRLFVKAPEASGESSAGSGETAGKRSAPSVRTLMHLLEEKISEGMLLMQLLNDTGVTLLEAREHAYQWTAATRQLLEEYIPAARRVFDDLEMGPLGALLDLLTPSLVSGGQLADRDDRQLLIDMTNRRRANLARIYEHLLPMTLTGSAAG